MLHHHMRIKSAQSPEQNVNGTVGTFCGKFEHFWTETIKGGELARVSVDQSGGSPCGERSVL